MFDFVDFHQKSVLKSEEIKAKEEQEKNKQFKKKAFGGITTMLRQIEKNGT